MKIAITGATGKLGQLVIQHLLKHTKAENIIALVRDLEKVKPLKSQGIEVRHFDYDVIETLESALKNIDKLLLISGNAIGRRTPQHQAVIHAAKNAGVPYIAYTSLLNASSSPLGLAQEHRETEQLILESGLNYTFLRNNWYAENYLASLQQNINTGIILGAAGNGQINAASRTDYAEAAAIVLTTSGHESKTYELASSQSFTKAELANVISQAANTLVEYQNFAPEMFKLKLIESGMPEAVANFLADVDAKTADGVMSSQSQDLEILLGHPSIDLAQIVRNLI